MSARTTVVSNGTLINEFLEYARREQGRAADTCYTYARSLTSLNTYLAGRSLLTIEADVLRDWVHIPNAKTGAEVKPATVKRRTCELRSLYNYLHDVRNLLPFNTARKLHVPTVHNEEPKPAPEEAWRQLWASNLSLGDRVAFGLGYFCGLRRHEVTLLAPHNIVEVPHPRIGNFKRKGGKKMSLPYVSCVQFYEQRRPDLIGGSAETFLGPFGELLAERQGSPRLLPWKEDQTAPNWQRHDMPVDLINPGSFNKRLRLALDYAELPELEFSPHQLRHSFGTNMLDMGMSLLEVSRLMGHSSVAVTQRYVATLEDPFQSKLDDDIDTDDGVLVSGPWG